LTVRTAAELCRTTETRIHELIQGGRLRSQRIGGATYVDIDLDRLEVLAHDAGAAE
jgi:hypothetical protein